jgi:hypothetical protein
MFGLEKGPDKGNKNIFEFDLEKDLKTNPASKKKLTKEIEEKVLELKNILRKGMDSDEEFEQHGMLLRGYAALQKVINRITK